ncbi:MAG: hypothetical protein E2P02_12200 [Acidobacteria bacterium]|nr:MAG: hypothetical protein E2P02_12200 [Acidobacteriota bacterium]
MVTSSKTLRPAASLALATALLIVAFAPLGIAQDEKDKKEEKFYANIGGGGARAIELSISRWSTPSQRARLIGALHADGQAAMMKILEQQPETGWIRIQGGRYPRTTLRYAFESKTKDGKRHIVVLTPRPISLGEARRNNQSLDYDLSMIELFVSEGGKGNGAIVAGAQVEIDDETKRFKITAYQTTPTKLVNVYTK